MDDRPYYSDLHDAWFFYDECGDVMGPYSSYEKAMAAHDNYCYWLNHGEKWWWIWLFRITGGSYVPF